MALLNLWISIQQRLKNKHIKTLLLLNLSQFNNLKMIFFTLAYPTNEKTYGHRVHLAHYSAQFIIIIFFIIRVDLDYHHNHNMFYQKHRQSMSLDRHLFCTFLHTSTHTLTPFKRRSQNACGNKVTKKNPKHFKWMYFNILIYFIA